MELVVDLERVTVVLADPEAVERVAVRVGAPPTASAQREADVHRLGDVLVASNVGRLDAGGDAFIRPDAVRFHAAGQVGAAWDARFTAMYDGTLPSGQDDPHGGLIHAPVVWPAPGDEGARGGEASNEQRA